MLVSECKKQASSYNNPNGENTYDEKKYLESLHKLLYYRMMGENIDFLKVDSTISQAFSTVKENSFKSKVIDMPGMITFIKDNTSIFQYISDQRLFEKLCTKCTRVYSTILFEESKKCIIESALRSYNGNSKALRQFISKQQKKHEIPISMRDLLIHALVDMEPMYGKKIITGRSKFGLDPVSRSKFSGKQFKASTTQSKKLQRKVKTKEDKFRIYVNLLSVDEAIKCYEKNHKKMSFELKCIIIERILSERKEYLDTLIEREENANIILVSVKPEDMESFEKKTKLISSLSDLTIEEATKNPDIKYIGIHSSGDAVEYYSIREFIEIKKEMAKLLEDVPHARKDDIKSQLEVFALILGNIKERIVYDKFAVSPEGRKSEEVSRHCRNLYGGLVNGKCVCRGFSLILKEALKERGIESRVINGYMRTRETDKKIRGFLKVDKNNNTFVPPEAANKGRHFRDDDFRRRSQIEFYNENLGGHAWNLVKIGGRFFNCDPTNVTSFRRSLLSDAELNDKHSKYKYYKAHFLSSDELEPCDTSLTELLREKGIDITKGTPLYCFVKPEEQKTELEPEKKVNIKQITLSKIKKAIEYLKNLRTR